MMMAKPFFFPLKKIRPQNPKSARERVRQRKVLPRQVALLEALFSLHFHASWKCHSTLARNDDCERRNEEQSKCARERVFPLSFDNGDLDLFLFLSFSSPPPSSDFSHRRNALFPSLSHCHLHDGFSLCQEEYSKASSKQNNW